MNSAVDRYRNEPKLDSEAAEKSAELRRVEVRRASLAQRMGHYLRHHASLLSAGLGPLRLTMVPALFACLAVGTMLALGLAAVAVTKNVQRAAGVVSADVRVLLFLRLDAKQNDIVTLAQSLRSHPDVDVVNHISPEQGLEELRQVADVDPALAILESNPLPHVLEIQPKTNSVQPERLKALASALEQEPLVERLQLDLAWAEKVSALLRLLREVGILLGALLAVAVALVIGNTVRLAVDARREEIEVQLLVGATRRYVRRPYLYAGTWLGVLGGLIAWWVVNLGLWWLQPSVSRLSQTFGSDFGLALLEWKTLLPLLALAGLVGWLGAWVSAGHQLRRFSV